jgi:transcriptional regulator with XRE-family HTH domain
MKFSALLRELRDKAGLTQEQLAEKAGIALSTLRNHEQGHRLPSWSAVVKLAKALGVSTDEFAKCDEVNEPEKPTAKKGKGKK